MARLHRSISRRVKGIDASKVANRAEDYVYSFGIYKKYLNDVRGIVTVNRIKTYIKKIDEFEKEMIKLEDKMEKLQERRNLEAARLEDDLDFNLGVVENYLEPEEFSDFR
ncbi:hypothetical protein HN709_02885 [Candidatus Peregrinibacteria bacterium]|jgi:hypothetical protein|nr:hypothetical protein [Candidatus Peregrinibacteria bacterium]MBT7736609.1 hypothetical protein [Candidatus Peregrinibacteria bacterium]